MKLEDIQDCLCDLYDVKRQLPKNILSMPKDNDGTDATILDCLENVIEQLTVVEQTEIELSEIELHF